MRSLVLLSTLALGEFAISNITLKAAEDCASKDEADCKFEKPFDTPEAADEAAAKCVALGCAVTGEAPDLELSDADLCMSDDLKNVILFVDIPENSYVSEVALTPPVANDEEKKCVDTSYTVQLADKLTDIKKCELSGAEAAEGATLAVTEDALEVTAAKEEPLFDSEKTLAIDFGECTEWAVKAGTLTWNIKYEAEEPSTTAFAASTTTTAANESSEPDGTAVTVALGAAGLAAALTL